MHFVMTKSVFLLPLALSLLFQPHHTAAQGKPIQTAAKNTLIQTACAATSAPPLCSSTLQVIANSPYLNPTNIAATAVQAASKTAVATVGAINTSLTVDLQIASDPAVKQSLASCVSDYQVVLTNMNSATQALTQNVNTPQVPTYLRTALDAASKCDASGITNAPRVAQIASQHIDVTKMIKNSLEIYQVFANFITNPNHDPSKGGAPPLGGGLAGAAGGGGAGPGPLGGGGGGLLRGGGAGGGGLLGGGGAGGGGLLGGGGSGAGGGGLLGGGGAGAGGAGAGADAGGGGAASANPGGNPNIQTGNRKLLKI